MEVLNTKLLDIIEKHFTGKKYKDLSLAVITSQNDKNFADVMIRTFRNANITCWYSENLLPGQDWEMQTKEECRKAKYVLVLISKKANKEESEYQLFVKWALHIQGTMPYGAVKTIPIKVQDCETPGHMTEMFSVEPNEKEWQKLIAVWEKYQEA